MAYSLLYRTHKSLRLPENQASELALVHEFCSLRSIINVLGPSSLSHFCSLLWVDLLSVLVVSDSWRGCSVSSAFAGANSTIAHQFTSLCPNVCKGGASGHTELSFRE